MARLIRDFDYSAVKGRGKGVLSLKKFQEVKNLSSSSKGSQVAHITPLLFLVATVLIL